MIYDLRFPTLGMLSQLALLNLAASMLFSSYHELHSLDHAFLKPLADCRCEYVSIAAPFR